jgi:hypothetical protein
MGVSLDSEDDRWVQLGFARYKHHTGDVWYDEPLAYLTFDQWCRVHYKESKKNPWGRCLDLFLNRGSGKVDGLIFENILALYLAHCFSSWTRLGEVFQFLDGEHDNYATKQARLVTYVWTGPHFEATPVASPLDGQDVSSPAHVLIFNAKTDEDVFSWFGHREKVTCRAPFCRPTDHMGPDVLFHLEVESLGVFCVALQCKVRNISAGSNVESSSVGTNEEMDWFCTVTPENFWSSKVWCSSQS